MKSGVCSEVWVRVSGKEDEDDGVCRWKGGKDWWFLMWEMLLFDVCVGGVFDFEVFVLW